MIIFTIFKLFTELNPITIMKNVSFTVFSTLLFLNCFSQTNINTPQWDASGYPLTENNVLSERAPYESVSTESTVMYDSVRSLSEINSTGNADAFPWISPDGLRLYYTSGAYGDQMVFTQRATVNSPFQAPVLVPLGVSGTSYTMSSNELDVNITGNSTLFYTAHRATVSSPFDPPVNIKLIAPTYSSTRSASFNNAHDKLYILLGFGTGLSELTRTGTDTFTFTRKLRVPSGYAVGVGQLSKDELTYYLGATTPWGSKKIFQLSRATPADTFAVSSFQAVAGISDTTSAIFNDHPSMSDNLEWVAFVRATQNLWTADELFLAHANMVTSVFDNSEKELSVSVFPNPSEGNFTITSKGNDKEKNIQIFNSIGEMVGSEKLPKHNSSIEIDLSGKTSGIYFINVSDGQANSSSKVILR